MGRSTWSCTLRRKRRWSRKHLEERRSTSRSGGEFLLLWLRREVSHFLFLSSIYPLSSNLVGSSRVDPSSFFSSRLRSVLSPSNPSFPAVTYPPTKLVVSEFEPLPFCFRWVHIFVHPSGEMKREVARSKRTRLFFSPSLPIRRDNQHDYHLLRFINL